MKIFFEVGFVFLALSLWVHAGTIVRWDNGGSSITTLGDQLDEMPQSEAPKTVDVPEIPGLSMTIHQIEGDGTSSDLDSTAESFGINSNNQSGVERDRFNVNESVTFSFNKDVLLERLDFRYFEDGESFAFGAVIIPWSDLSNKSSDYYDFSSPLFISAGEQIKMYTLQEIGLQAMTITAVPEPSSGVSLLFAGSVCLWSRKR